MCVGTPEDRMDTAFVSKHGQLALNYSFAEKLGPVDDLLLELWLPQPVELLEV